MVLAIKNGWKVRDSGFPIGGFYVVSPKGVALGADGKGAMPRRFRTFEQAERAMIRAARGEG